MKIVLKYVSLLNSNYFVCLSSSVVEYKMSKHIFSNIEKIGYFQYLKIFTCHPTTDERLKKRVLLYILECDIFFSTQKSVFTLSIFDLICLHWLTSSEWDFNYNLGKFITKCLSALHNNFFCTQPNFAFHILGGFCMFHNLIEAFLFLLLRKILLPLTSFFL